MNQTDSIPINNALNSLEDKLVFSLNPEQHDVLDQIHTHAGVLFLTGKAGTGKSTLLNIYKRLHQNNLIILAPTGVAAINVRGQTIHSFFRFPPGWIQAKDYKLISSSMVKKIDRIIIDEISMVRADMLDHIDQILRLSTHKNIPFGGIPMLWIGDLYQLPPIVSSPEERSYFKTEYESPYFFSAHVMKELKSFQLVELSHIFRQQDKRFIKLLNEIRLNDADHETLDEINERCVPIPSDQSNVIITLTSTNAAAQQINLKKLEEIDHPSKIYTAKIEGLIKPSQYPLDQHLLLKQGAQIMTMRNDPGKNFVNGSLGIIEELKENSILVHIENQDKLIDIQPVIWEIIRYTMEGSEIKTEVIGSFTQLPVKLAWAVTIHKSQGKTFEHVIIDLGKGAFENGQVYVALSRCKTLDGIYLTQKLSWKDIRTDERVTEFLQQWA